MLGAEIPGGQAPLRAEVRKMLSLGLGVVASLLVLFVWRRGPSHAAAPPI